LVPMASEFGTTYSVIQWVITAFFLAQAAVIPIAGYLGNRFGMKRSYIIVLCLFTLSSLLCALASTEQQLILFRVLQGLAGGALFPLAQAIATEAFPIHERQKGSMIIGISVLLGPIFGPTLGGYLIDLFSWPAIFTINLPVGAITVLLAILSFPPDKKSAPTQRARFDYLGLLLSVAASVMLVYAFALVTDIRPGSASPLNPRGEMYGWTFWGVWALLGGGLGLLLAFVFYELRHNDPVLDIRSLKHSTFTAPSVMLWFMAMIIFGSILLLPIFFQQIRNPHLSATNTGLALMPQGIGAAVATVFAARLYYKLGVRALVLIGIALLTLSGYLLTFFETDSSGGDVLVALSIRGLGFGFAFIPLQTLALQRFMGAELAKASSLLNVGRQIFASIGVSVIVTMLMQHITRNMEVLRSQMPPVPEGLGTNLSALREAMPQVIAEAGTGAVNEVMWILFFATAALVVLVPLLPRRKKLVAMFSAHPVV